MWHRLVWWALIWACALLEVGRYFHGAARGASAKSAGRAEAASGTQPAEHNVVGEVKRESQKVQRPA